MADRFSQHIGESQLVVYDPRPIVVVSDADPIELQSVTAELIHAHAAESCGGAARRRRRGGD